MRTGSERDRRRSIEWLRGIEWSVGNGQCPQCHGLAPGKWARSAKPKGVFALRKPNPHAPDSSYEGHLLGCPLARTLEWMGEKTVRRTAPLEKTST